MGESPSLIATRFVKASPPLPLTLLHLKLVLKPGGVKVRFTKTIQNSLMKKRATTLGYLVTVAGLARSLGCDATKIVKVIAAILAAYWTRLLAAALVTIILFDAHSECHELEKVGSCCG